MSYLIRSAAELVGMTLIAIAAFLLHPIVGFGVTGVLLILAANFGGRLDPSQPPREPER